MDFNKQTYEIINFLTSGDTSEISELSYNDSDADFEISDCVQQGTGENDSEDNSDHDNQRLAGLCGKKLLLRNQHLLHVHKDGATRGLATNYSFQECIS